MSDPNKPIDPNNPPDASIDPTPPVQKFAAHHLMFALAVLGALLGALAAWAFGGH